MTDRSLIDFVVAETTYDLECSRCGYREQYSDLQRAERDGWCVGEDSEGIGLFCRDCGEGKSD